METIRLRLLFENRHLLSDSQRKEGLKRSWIFTKPQHTTISDLSSYILTTFQLHEACPNGLILSMDGFVLPLFESTCILRDKDVVRVKKKGSKVGYIDNVSNGERLEEIEDQQADDTGVKLLADQQFEKESGGYESEPEIDEPVQSQENFIVNDILDSNDTSGSKKVSKKRKASKMLHSSRKKKTKSAPIEQCPVIPAGVQHAHAADNESNHPDTVLPRKTLAKKGKSSNRNSESDKTSSAEIDGRRNDISKSTASAERPSKLQCGRRSADMSDTADGSKKTPSRSARRKKAKRRWLREKVKAEKEEQQRQLLKEGNQKAAVEDNHRSTEEQPADDSDVEDDIVPVVIRPGHIRFEPIGKDQAVQQNHNPVEISHWNGITSKKRGQKWGTEKVQSCKRNDYKERESSSTLTTEPEALANDSIEFDKLRPYTSLPKEGDVVAYRLIELSSSWTPELSSFRVGKIAWYETETNRIMLISVPEYPIVFKKGREEESAIQNTSLYAENGSLKIDYSSLVDLRIVKYGNPNCAKAATDIVNEICVATQSAELDSGLKHNNSNLESHAMSQVKGKVNAWDEISKSLDAKRSQLSQDKGWNRREISERSSWSRNGLRGSTLGPTVALLRAKNGL